MIAYQNGTALRFNQLDAAAPSSKQKSGDPADCAIPVALF